MSQLWWLGLIVLLVLALATVRRPGGRIVLIPLLMGAAVAAQYLFTVAYAAPRFLIPAYALLSLPAAAGAAFLVESIRSRTGRRLMATALGIGLVGHAAIQLHVLTTNVALPVQRSANRIAAIEAQLAHRGVHGHCLVMGDPANNGNLAYALRCTNVAHSVAHVRHQLAVGVRVLWLSRTREPGAGFGAHWQRIVLPGGSAANWLSDPVTRAAPPTGRP